jgi:hypothetical protein
MVSLNTFVSDISAATRKSNLLQVLCRCRLHLLFFRMVLIRLKQKFGVPEVVAVILKLTHQV